MFAFSCPVGLGESLVGHYRETEFSDCDFGGWFKILELDLFQNFGLQVLTTNCLSKCARK